MISEVDAELDPIEAFKTAVTFEATPTVVIVKVAEFAPEGTVTVGGTDALALFEARLTVTPFGPAAVLISTVPITDVPP